MEKRTITNRKGQKIVVLFEKIEDVKGLAFVMHGLGGTKDQPHIQTFAEVFKERGMTVVRFDTTNSFGESDGHYEHATVTNYYEDLEDVIAWAKTQQWYQEPFYLAGHSLGGLSVLLYAEKYPEKVKGLAPISTVVSGELRKKAQGEAAIKEWKKTGMRIEERKSKPGTFKQLKWSHMIDQMRYDAFLEITKLTMPVLLIVGDQDVQTPLAHQQLFFDALQTEKELHVIKGAFHDFTTSSELREVKDIFLQWIKTTEVNK